VDKSCSGSSTRNKRLKQDDEVHSRADPNSLSLQELEELANEQFDDITAASVDGRDEDEDEDEGEEVANADHESKERRVSSALEISDITLGSDSKQQQRRKNSSSSKSSSKSSCSSSSSSSKTTSCTYTQTYTPQTRACDELSFRESDSDSS
jgi:hypothetical protein